MTVVRHIILTISSLSHQKEFELFLKTQFKKADVNKSGQLHFDEVRSLCKSLNIQMPKEQLKKYFDEANSERVIGEVVKNKMEEVLTEDEVVSFYYKGLFNILLVMVINM